MGFGSYDESEYERQAIDKREFDTDSDTRTVFEGKVAFESGANNDDLLTQLRQIKVDQQQQE